MQARLLADVPTDTLVAAATRLKDKGNLYFQQNAFSWAEKFYAAGIQLIELPPQAAANTSLACVLYSNRAQANLEMKHAQAALQDAQKALAIQADHAKSAERAKHAQEMLAKNVAPVSEYQDATGQITTSLTPMPLFKFKL
jgi:hypothetical protein